MNLRTLITVIRALKNERIRNTVIGITVAVFTLIFLPIAYFVTNNPIALGINEITGKYKNVQPIKANISQKEFIDTVAPGAIDGDKKYNIFASVTIAQAILESNWGHSGLTRKANNLFGIKAFNWTGQSVTMNTNENYGGINVSISSAFRAYSSPAESVEDHAKFLIENSTYKQHGVFNAKTYEQQAEALKSSGYATDPNYPALLVTLIREYNLDKYDK
jgi:stage II sporulation protein P